MYLMLILATNKPRSLITEGSRVIVVPLQLNVPDQSINKDRGHIMPRLISYLQIPE